MGAAVPSSPAQHKKMKSFPQLSPRARAHLPTSAAASDSPRGKPTHSPSPHPGIAQSNHSKLDMASGGCGGVSANVSPSPLGAPSCSPPFGSPRFRPRVISPRCSPRGNKQAACDALIYSNRNSEGLDGFPSPAEDVALESAAFESRLQILHSSLQNMSASVAAGAGAGAGAEDSAGAGGEDSADVSVYGSSVCEVSTVGIINPGSLLGGASSLIHGGPSTCLEYAASVREAEENVVQEMQRIRSRVQGKQHRKYRQFGHRQQHQHQQHDGKGLFSPEDSSCLLDGSYVDMSSDCSLATASFFPLEGSTDTL